MSADAQHMSRDLLLEMVLDLEFERDLLLDLIRRAAAGELRPNHIRGVKGSALLLDTVEALVRFAGEHEEMSSGLHTFNVLLGRAAARVGDARLARIFNEAPATPDITFAHVRPKRGALDDE